MPVNNQFSKTLYGHTSQYTVYEVRSLGTTHDMDPNLSSDPFGGKRRTAPLFFQTVDGHPLEVELISIFLSEYVQPKPSHITLSLLKVQRMTMVDHTVSGTVAFHSPSLPDLSGIRITIPAMVTAYYIDDKDINPNANGTTSSNPNTTIT